MEDPFLPLEQWLATAMGALDPARRRQLMAEIGRELRRRNQKRMAAQTGPDGVPWAPRKRDAHGRVRKTVKMMMGLRQARNMALTATKDGMELGYAGRIGRIAEVHHLGEVDGVERNGSGPKVKYFARALLGAPEEDLDYVRSRILQEIGQGG